MLASTLVGTALNWFSNMLGVFIMSLEVFTGLFVAHFVANKAKPLEVADLF